MATDLEIELRTLNNEKRAEILREIKNSKTLNIIGFRISKPERKLLEKMAKANNTSISDFIRNKIFQYDDLTIKRKKYKVLKGSTYWNNKYSYIKQWQEDN